jgi:hypothetical protein
VLNKRDFRHGMENAESSSLGRRTAEDLRPWRPSKDRRPRGGSL